MESARTRYEHRQEGPWHVVLMVASVLVLCSAWPLRSCAPVAGAGMLLFLALWFRLMFRCLVVRDEGEYLAVNFGPRPLIRRRFAYDAITSVEPGRLSWIDGWGIHWMPGRGWIYSMWGFGCVKIQLGTKTIRIGSDDVEALVGFLKQVIKPPKGHS